ncbi:DNA-binding transcriptional regulator, MarR family [Oscillibacter sp. PC13]|uniref:MarR family winged helix-turn-helix transcriptional regulator n=1 Tax=Oscillibacter sp. PC13 TaxID=1855299 RepID=UPI0008E41AB8|nr:MarR family transcriptional regulator [Oscillibacter sp. PC13]SFP59746.1 DNA-binding transcriptional regulator, MarR family [Oscillibacter sp. PC13]
MMEHEKALGPMLGRASHLARERLEARLSQYDVTPSQTHTLMYLHRRGGQAAQCELTAFLKVKPSTANGILDRMVEKNLVVRSVSGADARRRLITLTEKGQGKQAQFQQSFRESEDIMIRGFTPEETETFRELLGRVIQNLEEDRTIC